MQELLDGFAPGLPRDLHERILERAEGVPLYAVETVRMLLDRGLLERDGEVYRPTGEIDALEVPETLHALIAARLDGLTPDERRALQDAAVLGKSFTGPAWRRCRVSATTPWSRCFAHWCARRSSRCRPTRARQSAGSTASCKTC